MIFLILLQGALLESRNEDLETPLLLATSIRDHKLVTLLLSRGAQLNVRDKEGMNPLHWAVLGNDFNCVVAILEHLYKSSSHHQATQFLHSLLRSQEKSGYTPLTLAQVHLSFRTFFKREKELNSL
jgi:ankyrin repeat protein